MYYLYHQVYQSRNRHSQCTQNSVSNIETPQNTYPTKNQFLRTEEYDEYSFGFGYIVPSYIKK